MGPRRKDPARFPAPRAGRRIGHRTAALMAGLLAGLLMPAAAQAQIKVRKADCFFAADGRTVIDGVCEFLTDARSYGVGGFRLATYTNGYLRDGVVVSVTAPGQGTATWNREPGGKPEDGPADSVTAEGACWTGSRSRICAWKVGEGRPGFGGAPAGRRLLPRGRGRCPPRRGLPVPVGDRADRCPRLRDPLLRRGQARRRGAARPRPAEPAEGHGLLERVVRGPARRRGPRRPVAERPLLGQ